MRFTISGIGWVTPSGVGSGPGRIEGVELSCRTAAPGCRSEKRTPGGGGPTRNRAHEVISAQAGIAPAPAGDARDTRGAVFRLGSGPLPVLKSGQFLETPHPRFGRFDAYAKAGFSAVALALRSAGLDRWTQKRPFGLVVGTCRGCLEADLAYFQTAACDGGALASPNLFAYTLPSTMLGEASIQFGLTGPSYVVDDAPGHLAGIHAALDLLDWGLGETVVAGWCDVSPKRGHSPFSLHHDSPGRPPGEKEECPLFPREAAAPCGAVFVVLTRGPETAPWQWDGRELTAGTEPVADLATLAQGVVEKQWSTKR